MLTTIMILLFAGWPCTCEEPTNEQYWAVQCDGYEYVYTAPERLRIIEEVSMCGLTE